MRNHATFEFDSAQRYLSILASGEDHFTFQTFDDRKSGVIAPRRFNGTLDQCFEVLTEENHNGAGVFVTVNETNLAGHGISDVVAPRALWLELDRGLPHLPLTPSVMSETSSGKFHALFTVPELTWEVFDRVMPILAQRFQGDTNAIDRARVLRLPGFFHRKAAPNMVRIVEALTSARSYAVEEITQAFEIRPGVSGAVRANRQRGRVVWNGTEEDFEKVASALRAIETACDANGGAITLRTQGNQDELLDSSDRGWWLKVGFCLHHFFSGSEKGYGLWAAASGGDASLGFHGCPEKFDPNDQLRTWQGFSSLPAVINVPGRWRTIATIFWAAGHCGWQWSGRSFNAPVIREIHPSVDGVVDAGRRAVAWGLGGVLRAHAEQSELRYSGTMLKLVRGLLENVSQESGVGQVPPLQTVARELATTEGTIRSYLNRLEADGVIIKSNGAGRALKAKGIAYALTTQIITPTVADCYANVSTTTGGVTEEERAYPDEVKTVLHADGGNGIELWVEHVALPAVIKERLKNAHTKEIKDAEKSRVKNGEHSRAGKPLTLRIAQEFWHLHNAGLGHRELVEEVRATYADFEGIAAGRARRREQIADTERLNVNSLTTSQYLSAFLLALGRRALTAGQMSPEAQRILAGQRRFEEAKLAHRRQSSLAYLIAKDPDHALNLRSGTSS